MIFPFESVLTWFVHVFDKRATKRQYTAATTFIDDLWLDGTGCGASLQSSVVSRQLTASSGSPADEALAPFPC